MVIPDSQHPLVTAVLIGDRWYNVVPGTFGCQWHDSDVYEFTYYHRKEGERHMAVARGAVLSYQAVIK